jgi:hypothetical protein
MNDNTSVLDLFRSKQNAANDPIPVHKDEPYKPDEPEEQGLKITIIISGKEGVPQIFEHVEEYECRSKFFVIIQKTRKTLIRNKSISNITVEWSEDEEDNEI